MDNDAYRLLDSFCEIKVYKQNLADASSNEFLFVPTRLDNISRNLMVMSNHKDDKKGYCVIPLDGTSPVFLHFLLDSIVGRYIIISVMGRPLKNSLSKSIIKNFLVKKVEKEDELLYSISYMLYERLLIMNENADDVIVTFRLNLLREILDALMVELYFPDVFKKDNIEIYSFWKDILLLTKEQQNSLDSIFSILLTPGNPLMNAVRKVNVIWEKSFLL